MTPSHSPVKTAGAKAQMEQRLASGEFGIPPNVDFARYNEAWSQLIEQGPKTTYHQVCPLWIKEGLNDPNKKVVFECNKTREEVIIPAGVKLLVLKTQKKNFPFLSSNPLPFPSDSAQPSQPSMRVER